MLYPVLVNDMQLHPKKKNWSKNSKRLFLMGGGSVYKKAQLGKVKDGEYAESNEKSYFRFFR